MKTSMKINMMKFYKEIISVNTIKKLPLGGLGGLLPTWTITRLSRYTWWRLAFQRKEPWHESRRHRT